jgi:hypothetical protein
MTKLHVVPPSPVVPEHLVVAWADAAEAFAIALRRRVVDRKFAGQALAYMKAAHAVMSELEPMFEELLAAPERTA